VDTVIDKNLKLLKP
jgi:hydroxyacylglutathione hydrolase